MPELPEVETMSRDLNVKIRGKTIKDIWYDVPRMIHLEPRRGGRGLHHPRSREEFKRFLAGLKVASVGRRAKNVFINLSQNKLLAIHPKMTGHFLCGRWIMDGDQPIPVSAGAAKEKVNSYIHFLVRFSDGVMFGFSDARKFGRIIFGDRKAVLRSKEIKNLGPEPLGPDFTLGFLNQVLNFSRGRIKPILLDQSKIAGIGNIYADEILWRSRIHPLRLADSLSSSEIKNLFYAIKSILKSAIKMRGTSLSDYRDANGRPGGYASFLKAYGHGGEPCPRCETGIKRIVIGARSAHFCPKCQSVL